MTPKEKAKELYSKCEDSINGLEGYEWWESAKQCALICVDEIIKSRPCIPHSIVCESITDYFIQAKEYWQEVKKEIELL